MSEIKLLDVEMLKDNVMTAAITGLKNDKTYEIRIVASKQDENSLPSNEMEVMPHPTPTPPPPAPKEVMKGGVNWQDDLYYYCLFPSGATTGYEALRTEDGLDIECEVLMVGAGGSGKGQTMTLGKGGDGGGGQLVVTTLPKPKYAGSIFITVPNGGTSSSDSPVNTTVKEGDTILTAIAGKNATDKNDGAGYPSQEVPLSWQNLSEFKWLQPYSHFVGGSASSGDQNYPNATFDGQGGAGTKDTRPGKGGDAFVAIRWKK